MEKAAFLSISETRCEEDDNEFSFVPLNIVLLKLVYFCQPYRFKNKEVYEGSFVWKSVF